MGVSWEGVSMGNKYYRLMERPEADWKPYREKPMYDDHPDLGTFKSTTYVSNPQKGDYLIQSADGSMYVSRPSYSEHFDDVEFDAMPPLQELMAKGVVVEVPATIARTEFYLQGKMSDLALEIQTAEEYLEDLEREMLKRRFGFPTKASRQAKQEYFELKPVVLNMNKQFDDLDSQFRQKVLAPLKELQKQRNQKRNTSLDQTISRSEGICRQQAHNNGFVMGKEPGHDR